MEAVVVPGERTHPQTPERCMGDVVHSNKNVIIITLRYISACVDSMPLCKAGL